MCPFTGADAGMAPGVSAIVSALSARDKALLLPTSRSVAIIIVFPSCTCG